MRLVIQRVKGAHVDVGGETVGRVGPGLMVLVGVEEGDTRADVWSSSTRLNPLRNSCMASDVWPCSVSILP